MQDAAVCGVAFMKPPLLPTRDFYEGPNAVSTARLASVSGGNTRYGSRQSKSPASQINI